MWNVHVDNIGNVYTGPNGFTARKEYGQCRKAWPGSGVALMRDDEIVQEFDPNAGFMFVEMTDTFGGEANYCWVNWYVVRAKTFRGAMCKVPGSWHKVADFSDMARYDSQSGLTCCFVEHFDPEQHGAYRLDTDERAS